MRTQLSALCCFLFLVSVVRGVAVDEFFVYGPEYDATLTPEDDVSSEEAKLQSPIVFYEQLYNSLYVNSNGLISFLTEIPSFFNVQFPLDYPIIAPLYTDVDLRGTGTVFYRETEQEALIARANLDIQRHFSNGVDFWATSLFIVTWRNVGYFERNTDKVNTFQLVLATNGTDSFCFFYFKDGGVQWIQGSGKNPNYPDARAQSGFISGDGRLYTLRGSGTDQVVHLDQWSNVGTSGKWMFHIGKTGVGGNVMPPDLEVGDDTFTSPENADSCHLGATLCHSKATCVDYSPGFCCVCKSFYYGNGRNCLKEGEPHRVNGQVSGTVNGVTLREEDLHAYVVTSDGRAYTAVSRVKETIGYDIQSLTVVGSIIGWLFAKPHTGVVNGFSLTGGVFNHTAEVHFPHTGDHMVVQQQFKGVDVFNYLRLDTQLTGTLPTIPAGKKIDMADYEEVYTRVEQGLIRSQSSRSFTLKGETIETPFTVDQTINYTECRFDPPSEQLDTLRLKVARNFIVYDAKERIIRYAMTNKIMPMEIEDPCIKGREVCGNHSVCNTDGETFHCVCIPGYQMQYRSEDDLTGTCVDINECLTGEDHCDTNADCINEVGNYRCICQPGYAGDGFHCEEKLSCEDLGCDVNADCIENPPHQPRCVCMAGYLGNGHVCYIPPEETETCEIAQNCSPFGICIVNDQTRRYECRCMDGYYGDGYTCTSLNGGSCDVAQDCSPFADCLYEPPAGYVCRCREGYDGDGYSCSQSTGPEDVKPLCVFNECFCTDGYKYDNTSDSCVKDTIVYDVSCNEINNCHPHAQCIFDFNHQTYRCVCNAGYEGDGKECTKTYISCEDSSICSDDAECVYDDYSLQSVCICNEGFHGDGLVCTPLDECSSVAECSEFAQCTYDSTQRRFRCVCNQGYVGDGKICEPSEDAECNILNDCHQDAQCVYDASMQRYRCQCNSGFTGDGKDCNPSVIGCNILNDCDDHAVCMYDPQQAGYRCRCEDGYEGNGHYCRPSAPCNIDANVCDVNAHCVTLGHVYVCQCGDGFTGDGYTCKVSQKHDGNFLFVNQGMSVLRIPLTVNGERGRPVQIHPFQTAIGLDVDCQEGKVYWSDVSGKVIRRSDYNGTNRTPFVNTEIGSPEGLALDWISRNIYWTDSTKDTIEVANIDTGSRKVLISDGLVNPRGIAVHPSAGLLFWSDWNREQPSIEVSFLDGSERRTVVDSEISLPNSLHVDLGLNELCWADAGTKRIECSQLDGSRRRVIASGAEYPFGLTTTRDKYFWTDWNTKQVEVATKPTGDRLESLPVPLIGAGKLYAIVAVPERCPHLTNVCQFHNGQCPPDHMCLPNGRGGRMCACAEFQQEGIEVCNRTTSS